MIILKRFIEYAVYCVAILLAFLLVLEQYLTIPGFVKWIGQWHPLVLHFPIVLILVSIIQYWRRDAFIDLYLGTTTFLTFLTAVTGFLLSLEGGAKGNLIQTHQWFGVAVSYLMAIWYWIGNKGFEKRIIPVLQGLLIIIIVLTGHFGGMVTHGKDFLAFSTTEKTSLQRLPENPNIYAHIIKPILNEKCVSCHNPDKSKGALILSDFASIINGGESGMAVDQNDPGNSLVLKRILLPVVDEEHMPPEDEKQLTENEMILITEWIDGGTKEEQVLSDLESDSKSYMIVKELIEANNSNNWNELPEVSENRLNDLSSDYIRISRLFGKSNALQVIVYPHQNYKNSDIKTLNSINKNIIELNLSGLPISDQELEFARSCVNIEKLNISNTSLDDSGIQFLSELKNLSELKIYNTLVTDQAFNTLNEIPGLRSLFVYNTGMTDEGLNHFMGNRNEVAAILAAEEVNEFRSVLPSPTLDPNVHFFREPFKIKLNHPLNGIDIFYTIDGAAPDETSEKASDSMLIDKSMRLKFYAAKEGWVSSSIDSMRFFRSISGPSSYTLKFPPHSNFTGRGEKLLFDLDKGIDVFSDSAWMAFREDPLVLNCEWDEEIQINSVVLSSIVHTDPYLFPPESIIVRGGLSNSDMKVLASITPEKLQERSKRYYNFYECKFDPVVIRNIEISVLPLQTIPMWHRGKGEKGWFFIDEIVFQAD